MISRRCARDHTNHYKHSGRGNEISLMRVPYLRMNQGQTYIIYSQINGVLDEETLQSGFHIGILPVLYYKVLVDTVPNGS
jgi:hypothetical protein